MIVFCGSSVGLLFTMLLSAAEGTAQVDASGISGMGEKANAAMSAARQTDLETWVVAYDCVECVLILPDEGMNGLV